MPNAIFAVIILFLLTHYAPVRSSGLDREVIEKSKQSQSLQTNLRALTRKIPLSENVVGRLPQQVTSILPKLRRYRRLKENTIFVAVARWVGV